jgi:hypothetical protein
MNERMAADRRDVIERKCKIGGSDDILNICVAFFGVDRRNTSFFEPSSCNAPMIKFTISRCY